MDSYEQKMDTPRSEDNGHAARVLTRISYGGNWVGKSNQSRREERKNPVITPSFFIYNIIDRLLTSPVLAPWGLRGRIVPQPPADFYYVALFLAFWSVHLWNPVRHLPPAMGYCGCQTSPSCNGVLWVSDISLLQWGTVVVRHLPPAMGYCGCRWQPRAVKGSLFF